jgi:RNA polymerase sigma-70 factor (ECF subfamily)
VSGKSGKALDLAHQIPHYKPVPLRAGKKRFCPRRKCVRFPLKKEEGHMCVSTEQENRSLQRIRAYLETLTFIQIDPRLRGKVSWSNIIQNTMIEAWRILERLEAMESEDQKRFLRRMLLNNLKEDIDRFLAQCRDVRREKSIEHAAWGSSIRVRSWIDAEESTPSKILIKHEEELRVVEALAQLPERQRQAVILKHYHGCKLVEIAEYLGCTIKAAAGLHARGLANLRKLLADLE